MSTTPSSPDEPTAPLGGPIGNGSDSRNGGRSGFSRPPVTADSPPGPRAGDQIGPYRLLELLGEGGFGVVYLAERREPMVQRVALKVIKPGMDSRAVVARFEQERQALAVMDHPNVARVLDGGVTPSGRPYFAMELVKGEPITRFADRNCLTIRERLELFIPVCEAVQHAHMKGIIHRDLKPSNILVGAGEGERSAVVKVIDFGIAKAISQTLTDKTIFTEHGQLVGTPEYMSPEQAEMGVVDIDTRTDVYSLGVVLYELLSGTLPFDARTLRSAGYAEIQRMIREVDPPKPSTRLSGADDQTAAGIAKARQADRERIAGELRRELEWIPMKALRKDRARRYASAESLAADLRRYLDGKPLEAAPESRAYLVRKFVRRNRLQVLAASAVAASLVAGFVATGLALDRALTAEQGLRAQLAETERAQEAERQRADELKQVSEFQAEMLGQIDTAAAGVALMQDLRARFTAALEKSGVAAPERTARLAALQEELARVNATDAAAAVIDRTILARAVEALDERFSEQPVVDARLRQALSELYHSIGLYGTALTMQESVLETRRRVLGSEHPDTLVSMNLLGRILQDMGRFAEAEPYLVEALEARRRVLGEEHPQTLASISNLGFLRPAQGRAEEAEPLLREALEKRRRVLGEEHPDTLNSILNMAGLLQSRGRPSEAEPLLREALEKHRRTYGDGHPLTLTVVNNLGSLLASQGSLAEAEACFREALDKRRMALGEEHPLTISSIGNVGFILRAQGSFAEAEPFFSEALAKNRLVLGADHPDTLVAVNNKASLLQSLGKLEEAEPLFREVLGKRRRMLGDDHPQTIGSISNLGTLLRLREQLAEAEPLLREAEERFRRVLGEGHANTTVAIGNLGMLLLARGGHREALELLAPAESSARSVFVGGNAPRLASFLVALGRARAGAAQDAQSLALAEASLLEAHGILRKARGESHPETRECARWLVELYTAWHATEPAGGHDAKAAEWRLAR